MEREIESEREKERERERERAANRACVWEEWAGPALRKLSITRKAELN